LRKKIVVIQVNEPLEFQAVPVLASALDYLVVLSLSCASDKNLLHARIQQSTIKSFIQGHENSFDSVLSCDDDDDDDDDVFSCGEAELNNPSGPKSRIAVVSQMLEFRQQFLA